MTTTLAASALTLTSTLIAAAPAAAAIAPPSGAGIATSLADMPSTETTVSCSAGGMTGEARLTLASDGTRWTTTVDSYRITANGRSKGNINAYVYGKNFVGQTTLDQREPSRDAMVQNGQWQNLGLELSRSSVPWTSMAQASGTGVEFVFDKSGSDPRCSAGVSSSGAHRAVQHIATHPGVIDKLRPLTSCHVLTDDITCSIAETKTVTSSVTLNGSVNPTGQSLDWLTAGISSSWTSARSVDVRCTSPAMRRGQLFVAYPTGTTTEFRVQVNAFGVRIDGPGKAFEVASGIACEVV